MCVSLYILLFPFSPLLSLCFSPSFSLSSSPSITSTPLSLSASPLPSLRHLLLFCRGRIRLTSHSLSFFIISPVPVIFYLLLFTSTFNLSNVLFFLSNFSFSFSVFPTFNNISGFLLFFSSFSFCLSSPLSFSSTYSHFFSIL